MDPITIVSAWSAFKEIKSIGKRIFQLKVTDEVRKEVQFMIDKTSELYDKIIDLEDVRQSNRDLISELKEKVKKMENFENEIKNYKPCVLETGSFVYEFQTSQDNDKPPHYICATCVRNSKIFELHPVNHANTKLICHSCKSEYVFKTIRYGIA